MEIGTSLAAGTGAGQSAQTESATSALSSDFETFLRMLTTQMQNQDPLKPIESSDFAVQLATFSGVEQQVRTNQLLEGLAGQMNLDGLSQLAGWVGMEARVAAPAQFDGAPVTLYPQPATAAQEAVLVVRDARGEVVERLPVPVSTEPLTWAGAGANGTPRPAGLYSFELESYAGGDLISTTPVELYSRITEARSAQGASVLVLSGGAEVSPAEVQALRQAS
ncbi:MAG TPA: flagellar basal body rod modification protein [Aliiroseovarius sp.]|nr:flagellar basal body rod modification protein [Aliiroseovarius sp.]